MAKYEIQVKKSAVKEIKKLPAKELPKILKAIEALAVNPHPPQSIKLSGHEKYRLRVGAYRVLYAICDAVLRIYIVKVGHHRDVYR